MTTSGTEDIAGDEPELVRVQHAVAIQKAADIRALNDLLSVGWRAVSTASMGNETVLVILERAGSPQDIEEMRSALGYSSLTAEQ